MLDLSHPNPVKPVRPLTQVAVGVVHNAKGEVLYAQRPAGKPYAGWWEFPGGKIEQGESLADGLARELKEELGITIHDCHAWLNQRFEYPHAHVNLQFCHVRHFSGTPQSMEGQAFAWGSVAAPPLPFLPAALPVLKVLQLPQVLHRSSVARAGLEGWHAALQGVTGGVLIFDETELTADSAEQAFGAALAWKSESPTQRTLLVGSGHPAAWRGRCDGVHFSEAALLAAHARPSMAWVSASVTSSAALAAAKALGCDFVTLPSNAQAISWASLGEMLVGTEIAAYVSGARSDLDLPFAFAAGAAGIVLGV